MTGYTRADSVNNIADGNIINASDLDGEFDAVQAAFNSSTGHVHDGTAANGAPITKIGPTQDVVASAIALLPKTTATVDVGSSSLKFKDFFFSGAGSVTGTITAGGFSGPLNGTVGATTPAAGTFTSLSDSGNLTFTGTGNRITGDFSNATASNRVIFQTSTASANTRIGIMPNAASTGTAGPVLYSTNDPNNASVFDIRITDGVGASLQSTFNGTGSNLPMTFHTGGSERMRLDTSGNVGIGTSSPGFKLQVLGAIYQDNGYAQFGNYNAGGANSPVAGGVSFSTNVTNGQAEGDIWNGNDPALYANTGILFTQRLTSTTRRDLVFMHNNGNVGIGTNSPSQKLDVVNTANSGISIRVNSTNAGSSTYGSLIFGNDADSSVSYIQQNSSTNTTLGGGNSLNVFSKAGAMTFSTASTERMRIDSSGNVGIGTSSPTANNRLTLSDTNSSKLTLTGGSAQNGMLFNVVSASNQYYIGAGNNLLFGGDKGFLIYDVTNARAKFFVEDTTGETRTLATTFLSYYTGASERMRIDSSGNVGIGINSPTSKLHVFTSSAEISRFNSTATNGGYLAMSPDNATITYIGSQKGILATGNASDFAIVGTGANNMVFGTNSTERMRIDSSGNVLVTSAAGLGYGTGSGGTVTQATSKSTAVTLNKPTGQITMNAAALAANTNVSFTLNNSLLTATDTILIHRGSGGSAGVYFCTADGVGAGSCSITVRNTSAGSLSEAIVLNFTIIKGASA